MRCKGIVRIFAMAVLAASIAALAGCDWPFGTATNPTSALNANSSINSPTRPTPSRAPATSSGWQQTLPSSAASILTESTASPVPQASSTHAGSMPSQTTLPGSTASTRPASTGPTAPKSTGSTQAKPTQATPTAPKPTQTQPATAPSQPTDSPARSGLAHLLTQPNGQAMAVLYGQIDSCAQALTQRIPVDNLTEAELSLVFNCYHYDYPETFWLRGGYRWEGVNGQVTTLIVSYDCASTTELQQKKQAMESAVEAMLAKLSGGMSSYEKALTLYDALIDRCTYTGAANAHCAYGALVEGKAVCEGYAKAYQYLLYRAGIPAMYVTGTGNGESHGWNAMELDGIWYYADPTWDDPVGNDGSVRYYAYFGLSEAMMDWDHQPSGWNLPLPEANDLACNYYQLLGRLVTSFDRAQVTQWIAQGGELRMYVQGDPQQYLEQLKNNMVSMVLEAGMPYSSFAFHTHGREIIVTFA